MRLSLDMEPDGSGWAWSLEDWLDEVSPDADELYPGSAIRMSSYLGAVHLPVDQLMDCLRYRLLALLTTAAF